jgi:hypothetical protein
MRATAAAMTIASIGKLGIRFMIRVPFRRVSLALDFNCPLREGRLKGDPTPHTGGLIIR